MKVLKKRSGTCTLGLKKFKYKNDTRYEIECGDCGNKIEALVYSDKAWEQDIIEIGTKGKKDHIIANRSEWEDVLGRIIARPRKAPCVD